MCVHHRYHFIILLSKYWRQCWAQQFLEWTSYSVMYNLACNTLQCCTLQMKCLHTCRNDFKDSKLILSFLVNTIASLMISQVFPWAGVVSLWRWKTKNNITEVKWKKYISTVPFAMINIRCNRILLPTEGIVDFILLRSTCKVLFLMCFFFFFSKNCPALARPYKS